MGTVLVVGANPETSTMLRTGGGVPQDGAIELLDGPNKLGPALARLDGSVDAVVLGSGVRDPADAVLVAHSRDPDLSVLVLLDQQASERLTASLSGLPLPEDRVVQFRVAGGDGALEDALRRAVDTTRERRTRSTVRRNGTPVMTGSLRAEIEAERARLEALFDNAPVPAGWLWGPEHVVEYANAPALDLFGGRYRQLLGISSRDAVPEVEGQGYFELLDYVFETGDPFVGNELPVRLSRSPDGSLDEGYYTFIFQPTRDVRGNINGILLLGVEVTEQALARERINELAEAAAAERDRLKQVIEVLPEGILLSDVHGRLEVKNRAAEELLGEVDEDLRGTAAYQVRSADGAPYEDQRLPLSRAIREGEVVRGEQLLVRNAITGEDVPVLISSAPIRNKSGQVTGGVAAFRDIADLKHIEEELRHAVELKDQFLAARDQALAEADAASQRLTFLLEASTLLGASLDYPTTLDRLARMAVSSLADLCLIDMLEESGTIRRMAAVHADPARQPEADELLSRYAPAPGGDHPAVQVILSGRSVFAAEMPDEFLAATTRDEGHLELVKRLEFRSYMCVPLMARGRILGAITFVSTRPGRKYGGADVALAEDLARRAALAIDNSRLYSERTHVARTLQASLLPRDLPEIPGVEIAARYHAAGEGNEVGGDFYDLFDTGDGAWGIVIGDVCGKGAEAAAVTGLARYTVRAAAMRQRRPSRILDTLNEALCQQRSDLRFCTVAYVRLRKIDAGARLTMSCGGHPLPLILRADGTIEEIGRPGTLLGVFPDPDLSDQVAEAGPGDSLILFTDGVIGARGRDEVFSLERLSEALATATGASAGRMAERIEQAVLEFQQGNLRDDVAILVLRVTG